MTERNRRDAKGRGSDVILRTTPTQEKHTATWTHLEPAHSTTNPNPAPTSHMTYFLLKVLSRTIEHAVLYQCFFIYGSKKHCFTSAAWYKSKICISKMQHFPQLTWPSYRTWKLHRCVACLLACLHRKCVEQRSGLAHRKDWTAHSESNT